MINANLNECLEPKVDCIGMDDAVASVLRIYRQPTERSRSDVKIGVSCGSHLLWPLEIWKIAKT